MDLIFIRHARSIPNKNVGPSKWGISKEGESDITQLAIEEDIKKIDLLFCSMERKAQLTAQGVAKALGKEQILDIRSDKRLNEVQRDQGVFFDSEEAFKQAVKDSFEQKDQAVHSWEPVTQALNRFEEFMQELLHKKELQDETVGIVSHGTIMSLYFAKIGGYDNNPDELYKKWSTTTFCGWGKIVNGAIIRELS